MGLTKEQVEEILAKQREKQRGKVLHQHTQHRSNQKGPLRWYEVHVPCANHAGYRGSGCSSPTYCRVEGEPLCMMHALLRLNELVVEMDKRLALRGELIKYATQGVQQGKQQSQISNDQEVRG